MHREISHTDGAFQQESQLSLYLLTAFLGLLLGADLWPILASWLNEQWGTSIFPVWSNEIYGYRIALIGAVLGGARVLYGSLDALLQGRVGADLALAIACVAAILLKESVVAAEIVFIGLLGEVLESITFDRAQRAIRKLAEITPRRCWRLRDGREERILVSELQAGDVVVVKPGGRIPGDGVVSEGRSAVDVSALTGESLPVDKGPGDEVLAGSHNQFGALTIEVQRVGENTLLRRVIEMTSRALKDKAPIERTADRLARYFLPFVLGLAAVTFLGALLAHRWNAATASGIPLTFWEIIRLATYPALSVLVVACPCALILATPATVIAALGRLAGTGVLLKGGSALERLAQVDAFVFDKTGTLTEGRLELGTVLPFTDLHSDDLLRLAATAEQRSEHLIARLILDEARARGWEPHPVEEFQALPGAGVRTRTHQGVILVGNRRLLQEQGVDLSPEVEEGLQQLDVQGQTVLLVAQGASENQGGETVRVLGAIGVRDRVRQEAAGVLGELRQLGIERIAMLTGDREAVARGVGETLGIDEVHAELLPEQKADFVADWQKSYRVAMVGDGINDAAALARSDCGLAVGGSGADVAAEAGDVLLTINPNPDIPAIAPEEEAAEKGPPPQPEDSSAIFSPEGATQESPGQRPGQSSSPTPEWPGPRSALASLPLLVRLSRAAVRIIRQNILIFAFGVNLAGIVLTAWLWPLFTIRSEWYRYGPVAAVVYHQIGSVAVLLNAMRLLWFERSSTQASTWVPSSLVRLNAWMEQSLSVDEALHWMGHQWKPITTSLLLLLGLGWLASGYTQIEANEMGIVSRFGRPLPGDLQPGLYWRWPWPIERVRKVQPQRVFTVEIGFRSVGGQTVLPTARAWSATHGNDGILRMPEEGLMLTGDGNLVELQGTLHYVISDPRKYLFEASNHEALLRNALEGVLRELVASRGFADLLTGKRDALQKDALKRLHDRYRPRTLGLRFKGLAIQDLHPPQEVVRDYHAVTRAMEERDRKVNQEEREAFVRTREQESRKQETILQAKAEYDQRMELVQARRDAFLAGHYARSTLKLTQEWALVWKFLQAVFKGQSPSEALRDYQQQRAFLLAGQRLVHDFRLYWEHLSRTLTGRDKVFIDARKVPGRRTLWLLPEPPGSTFQALGLSSPRKRGPPGR